MATVFIEDDLLDSYKKALGAFPGEVDSEGRDAAAQIPGLIQGLIRETLFRLVAPGFERDDLTGCGTRHALEQHIPTGDPFEGPPYEGSFLCINLDCRALWDRYGFGSSDEVVQQLGAALMDDYEANSVYRFGGEGFVVVLSGDAQKPLPEIEIEGVVRKHSQVDVRLTRTNSPWVHPWILLHLDGGILEARPQGHVILCGDPPFLANEEEAPIAPPPPKER